jgi:thiol-disulfide isomerase/thioredoxin
MKIKDTLKRGIFTLLLVFAFFTFSEAQNIKSLKINQLLKEISQQDDTLRVVNLWATWCAPCVKELPHFEKARIDFSGKKIKIILVAVEDNLDKVKAFAQKKNLQNTLWFLDEDHANEWIPLIEKDWQGEIPVTLFLQGGKRDFHSGDFTADELFTSIASYLK